LCGQHLHPTGEATFELERERRALRARIKDLDAYSERVEGQIQSAEDSYTRASEAQQRLATELDARTAQQLAPVVAQREDLLRQLAAVELEQRDLERAIRWHDALDRRRKQVLQLGTRLQEVKEALDRLRVDQHERMEIVAELSERFSMLLHCWGFPKVDDPEAPFLDHRFVPSVRGRVYRAIGSDGAKTLIALAWMLAIFEAAIELGAPHPGFVMLDSVQQNLAPKGDEKRDEYMEPRSSSAYTTIWLNGRPAIRRRN
jgi:hypothetical protein